MGSRLRHRISTFRVSDVRDHIDALNALSPAQKTALHAASNRHGLIRLATHVGALTVSGSIIAFGIPGWWIAMLPHGVLLVFLFTLSHEATHRTPFAAKWLNEAVGHAIAPIIALPFVWFRYFHLAHHKYTNDPELDPEIAGHPRPRDWRSYALYLTGAGYWSGMAHTWYSRRWVDLMRHTCPHVSTRR